MDLERLASVSAALHTKMAGVDARIKRAEDAINAAEPGVEVWVNSNYGYGRCDDGWGILFRNHYADAYPQLLSKTSRERRIEAMPHLNTLVEEITRIVEAML